MGLLQPIAVFFFYLRSATPDRRVLPIELTASLHHSEIVNFEQQWRQCFKSKHNPSENGFGRKEHGQIIKRSNTNHSNASSRSKRSTEHAKYSIIMELICNNEQNFYGNEISSTKVFGSFKFSLKIHG